MKTYGETEHNILQVMITKNITTMLGSKDSETQFVFFTFLLPNVGSLSTSLDFQHLQFTPFNGHTLKVQLYLVENVEISSHHLETMKARNH